MIFGLHLVMYQVLYINCIYLFSYSILIIVIVSMFRRNCRVVTRRSSIENRARGDFQLYSVCNLVILTFFQIPFSSWLLFQVP